MRHIICHNDIKKDIHTNASSEKDDTFITFYCVAGYYYLCIIYQPLGLEFARKEFIILSWYKIWNEDKKTEIRPILKLNRPNRHLK